MDIGSVLEATILQFIGFNACYYAIAAIGLNVQFGYAGLLNFGQAAFMAAGAYGVGQTAMVFGMCSSVSATRCCSAC
jgi:ABC-type branched-subunit amino acid transport system permease subunit